MERQEQEKSGYFLTALVNYFTTLMRLNKLILSFLLTDNTCLHRYFCSPLIFMAEIILLYISIDESDCTNHIQVLLLILHV